MSEHTKVFEYQENGLSYTVTIYEQDGKFFADVLVNEGAMDVNAVYFGDDDLSGSSASLKGPLNMNGAGSEYDGEPVQWDEAIKLSDPGLGKAGTDKATYVGEGETLTIPLSITSLDDIDFFGIRATSTTTDSGSIKAVSGDPMEPEDPEDPTHDKVFFDYGNDGSGADEGGYFILSAEPESNPFDVPALPEGTEPTFENYVSYFEEIDGEIDRVEKVTFYETDEEGNLQESFSIDAPVGGFADADALIDAYDAAIAERTEAEPVSDAAEPAPEEDADLAGSEGLDLIAALTTEIVPEDEPAAEPEDEAEEPEMV